MLLSMLADSAAPYTVQLIGDCDVQSLIMDSREKSEKGLFLCIKGAHFDAHRYAEDAVANGAVALMVTEPISALSVPQLVVSNDRCATALIAAAFYGHPAKKLKLLGVTGTKGKTTTTYLVKAVLEKAGFRCGLIGTTGNMIGERWLSNDLTTPDPVELQRIFKQMADAQIDYVVMEVSAHAIHMNRLLGLEFEVACFTNFSQDHLDYFETMDRYFETKKAFFTQYHIKNAVLFLDDGRIQKLYEELSIPKLGYSICTRADVYATNIAVREGGIDFDIGLWKNETIPVALKLIGEFNVYNALAAAAICLTIGIEPKAIQEGIESLKSVPGRAEILDTHTPYKVILDYSHSPDSLRNILDSVRKYCKGRMILVFGCGGDRDKLKRPIMGEIAGKGADYTIITSDNPRYEDPLAIIAMIQKGFERTNGVCEVIENRREAIKSAMLQAEAHDFVILAGKGHETYQEIQGVKKPFDEKKIVQEVLLEMRRENGNGV